MTRPKERTAATLIVVACFFCVVPRTAAQDSEPDPVAAQVTAEKVAETRELEAIYALLTDREPTAENLITSLSHLEAAGERRAEVVTALHLITLSGRNDDTTKNAVLACYGGNAHWLVRVACLELLTAMGALEARPLAEVMLRASDQPLESKLLLGRHLSKRGETYAWPLLRGAILASRTDIELTLATDLLIAVVKYDGLVDPTTGVTVDASALRREIEQANAPLADVLRARVPTEAASSND